VLYFSGSLSAMPVFGGSVNDMSYRDYTQRHHILSKFTDPRKFSFSSLMCKIAEISDRNLVPMIDLIGAAVAPVRLQHERMEYSSNERVTVHTTYQIV